MSGRGNFSVEVALFIIQLLDSATDMDPCAANETEFILNCYMSVKRSYVTYEQ